MEQGDLIALLDGTKSLDNESEDTCCSNLRSYPDLHPPAIPLGNLLNRENLSIWKVAMLSKARRPKRHLPG